MKILYLTSKPVFPIVDGGCRAMAEILECFMLNGWQVDQLSISTEKHPFRKEAYPQRFSNVEAVEVSTKLRPWPALKALITGRNYNIQRFDSEVFRRVLSKKLAAHNYELIFLEGLFVTPYLEMCLHSTPSTLVVRPHNVEHRIWEGIAQNTKGRLKKWYLKKLATSLREYEINVLKSADLLLCITDEDKDSFRDLGVSAPLVTVPFSLPDKDLKNNYECRDFFFLGSMNWEPNQETVRALTERIFPAIKKRLPEAILHLAGSFMKETEIPADEGIHFDGFVEDPSVFFREKGIFLSPVYSGSGVRIKIMEAMSVGTPVITTTLGATGITNDNETIIIADTDQQLIEKAILLYEDRDLREKLGKNSTAFIRENFSRGAVSKKLRNVLEAKEA